MNEKDCKKWIKNKTINPRTGKKIQIGKKTYLDIEKECNKYKNKKESSKYESKKESKKESKYESKINIDNAKGYCQLNDKEQTKELSKIINIISVPEPITYLISDKYWDIDQYFGCFACSKSTNDNSKHNDAFRKSVDILCRIFKSLDYSIQWYTSTHQTMPGVQSISKVNFSGLTKPFTDSQYLNFLQNLGINKSGDSFKWKDTNKNVIYIHLK